MNRRKTQLDLHSDRVEILFDRAVSTRPLRKDERPIKKRVERRWRDSTRRESWAAENGFLFVLSLIVGA